ncbi:uncharacterized protein DFL_006374 [Arthrobotrys flagrans]|uniref:Uncharacterized protein n=1 Tax=Arthrobotrys flagrans TaxID=97331 RepID=A0A437A0U1_ARTFL|nr:hypothetical protein DFL_006374 [Arthrobotrys flagrans]
MHLSMRRHLLEAYLEVNTPAAFNIALKLATDLHLFSRVADNGFTSATIAALIRNGKHKACYDFILDSQIDKFEHPSLLSIDSDLFVLRRLREFESFQNNDIITESERNVPDFPGPGDVNLETATILLRLKCILDLKNLLNYNQISGWNRRLLKRESRDISTMIQQLEAWSE